MVAIPFPPDNVVAGKRERCTSASTLIGAGDETGSQHEPGAAVGDKAPPWRLPGPLCRKHEQRHNDGANRLGGEVRPGGVAGWRGEVNVPGLTQVRPDLLVQVSEGTLGARVHCIEFERTAVSPQEVERKLGPYRRMAAAGRPLPLLMVCETARGRQNFRAAAGALPMLTTTLERALAGPVTGAVTVWSRNRVPAALYCPRR